MGKVLILGAGQLGVFSARAMAERGVEVMAADLDPAPGYFARFGPRSHCELVSLNVLDRESVMRVMSGDPFDSVVVVFGLGGNASMKDPAKAWEINVRGPMTVAEAALQAGIRRLVFLSSFAVYGRPPIDALREETPTEPISEYGRMKLAAETLLASVRERGLDIRILRPCGVYGPLRFAQGSHSAQLIEALLFGTLRGQEMTLRTSAVSADEYLYVKDLGEAIAAAAVTEIEEPHRLFNVGSGRKTTAEDLSAALRQVIPGARVRIEPAEPEHDRPLPPLETSRLRETFGFVPAYDLVSGLADYVAEAGWGR